MKIPKIVAIVLGGVACLSTARADYTIIFATYRSDSPGYASNPVFESDGTTRLDANYKAELWVGDSNDPATMKLAETQTFVGNLGAGGNFSGHVDGNEDTITSTLGANSTAFYQIRAFRSADGSTYAQAAAVPGAHVGLSAVTQFTAGGQPPGTPLPPPVQAFANIHSSFNLSVVPAAVPEPSVLALGLLGGAALVFRRRK